MTDDSEIRMPVGEVLRHAGSVDAAADGMETGRGAAARVQLGSEVYGRLCAFLPGLIDPLADRAVTALAESASTLRETAVNLRSVAAGAEAADARGAGRVGDAGGRI